MTTEKKDYSKEIFEKYYNPKGKILKIILKDGSVLEGILAGFFHGDAAQEDPFITKWHFIPENEIKKYHAELLAVGTIQEYGRIIQQEAIKSVNFR